MIALNSEHSENLRTAAAALSAGSEAESLLRALNWRYAVKRFDPARAIDAGTWNALEEALVLTASGIGLQPWKFLVIDDPAVRARLREASYGQPQIVEADKLVVFAARTGYSAADVDRFIARVAEVRGQSLESLAGLRNAALSVVQRPEAERNAWAARQPYIALGNFLTSAALLGVDACPMEGFEPAKYNEILGLNEQGYTAVVVAAAGYRSPEDRFGGLAKVRFPRDTVLTHV
ncbi:MAG: nitroreductase [Fibrobacteria bacterium]|jgi:nitroreductase|nr:nitroreductase [Fibrobacteria bacterium]